MGEIIDTYHYNKDEDNTKKNHYENKLSLKEKRKTKKIRNRVNEYIKELSSKESLVGKSNHHESDIKYLEDVGYISLVKDNRDNVDVYYYGKEEDEAFYNAIIDYELFINMQIEIHYRETLNEDYSYRFGEDTEDYHGPFYIAELSLQDFKWHYNEYIPEQILFFFEKYIHDNIGPDFKYDFSENRIVKRDKQKIKARKDN